MQDAVVNRPDDDEVWGLEKQQAFLKSFSLHHSDSLELFQLYNQWSGMNGGITPADALEMFDTFPETRRRDMLTIGAYYHQMEKIRRKQDREKKKK